MVNSTSRSVSRGISSSLRGLQLTVIWPSSWVWPFTILSAMFTPFCVISHGEVLLEFGIRTKVSSSWVCAPRGMNVGLIVVLWHVLIICLLYIFIFLLSLTPTLSEEVDDSYWVHYELYSRSFGYLVMLNFGDICAYGGGAMGYW